MAVARIGSSFCTSACFIISVQGKKLFHMKLELSLLRLSLLFWLQSHFGQLVVFSSVIFLHVLHLTSGWSSSESVMPPPEVRPSEAASGESDGSDDKKPFFYIIVACIIVLVLVFTVVMVRWMWTRLQPRQRQDVHVIDMNDLERERCREERRRPGRTSKDRMNSRHENHQRDNVVENATPQTGSDRKRQSSSGNVNQKRLTGHTSERQSAGQHRHQIREGNRTGQQRSRQARHLPPSRQRQESPRCARCEMCQAREVQEAEAMAANQACETHPTKSSQSKAYAASSPPLETQIFHPQLLPQYDCPPPYRDSSIGDHGDQLRPPPYSHVQHL